MEKALEALKSSGAEIVEEIDLGVAQEDLGFAVLLHEFKANLNAYLAKTSLAQPLRTFDDVIAFNTKHQAKC